jgi:hypothetical protein
VQRKLINVALRAATLAALSAGMVACGGGGGGGDGGDPPPATFSIGGNVTGLAGAGLVLRNNGANDLAVNAAGAFTFAARVNAGAAYAVTVATQPAGQTCSVANGSGTASAQVSNVNVSCVDVPLAFDPAAAFQVNVPLPLGNASNVAESATATNPANGTSLLVYIQSQGDAAGTPNVFARVLPANGSPGEQQLIGQANGRAAAQVRVKYGPNGKAIAIWRQGVGGNTLESDVVASVYAAGQWSAATSIARTTQTGLTDEQVFNPDIAFDTAGNAVAVWVERGDPDFNKVKSAAFNDATSSWAAPQLVAVTVANELNVQPRIAMITSSATPNYLVVALRQGGPDDGKLTAHQCGPTHPFGCDEDGINDGSFLPNNSQGFFGGKVDGQFDMASNAAGDVVVTWPEVNNLDGRVVTMTSRSAGLAAEWRPLQFVPGSEDAPLFVGRQPSVPKVHVAEGGTAVLVWSQRDPGTPETRGVLAQRFAPTDSGAMAAAPRVRVDTAAPETVAFAANTAGKALLLWSRPLGEAGADGQGLFSSALDITADTLLPGPVARVENSGAADIFSASAALGPDGKGVAHWIEIKVQLPAPTVSAMANRFK